MKSGSLLSFVSRFAVTAIVLTGCGGGSQHTTAERYFLLSTNIKVPYWQEAGAGLVAAGKQLNVRAELVGPDAYDPAAQKIEFRRIMGLKPAGILVSPADPELLKDDINAAIAAGIPVITVDSDAPSSQRLFFIGTNNYQAGLMGGSLAAKSLNGKGNVVVLTIPAQLNLVERFNGYKAAFDAHPQIKISEVIDVHGDPRIAFDRTSEILENNAASVDAFVCLEALGCQEVAEVISRKKVAGKKVFAMDTQPATLDGIEKGIIDATIGQKPFTMAYTGLKMLADLKLHPLPSLTGDIADNNFAQVPMFIDTGATLIDKANLAKFKDASSAARASK